MSSLGLFPFPLRWPLLTDRLCVEPTCRSRASSCTSLPTSESPSGPSPGSKLTSLCVTQRSSSNGDLRCPQVVQNHSWTNLYVTSLKNDVFSDTVITDGPITVKTKSHVTIRYVSLLLSCVC